MGAPQEAQLETRVREGVLMEHYTNIHRLRALLLSHPLVSTATPHKVDKALDPKCFDEDGWAYKYHQSPWDLSFTLGWATNHIKKPLAAMWWLMQGKAATADNLAHAEAIFLDPPAATAAPPPARPLPPAAIAAPPPARPAPPAATAAPPTAGPQPLAGDAARAPARASEPAPERPPAPGEPAPQSPPAPSQPAPQSPPAPDTACPVEPLAGAPAAAPGASADATSAASALLPAASVDAGAAACDKPADSAPGGAERRDHLEDFQLDEAMRMSEQESAEVRDLDYSPDQKSDPPSDEEEEGVEADPAEPQSRVRRRSRSRAGPARPRDPASGGADGEIDLTMHVSAKRLQRLTEDQKERLRQIVRTSDRQLHFGDYWQSRPRAGGPPREPAATARARDRHRALLLQHLRAYADPIPDAAEFIAGIPSKNAGRWGVNEDVVKAIAIRKVHYMHLLTHQMEHDRLLFCEEWPDLSPASGGWW
ncbi:unnamed protein product, partial [Prorocentrum cordatum]